MRLLVHQLRTKELRLDAVLRQGAPEYPPVGICGVSDPRVLPTGQGNCDKLPIIAIESG